MILNRIRVSTSLFIAVLFLVSLSQVFAQSTPNASLKQVNINGDIQLTKPVEWVYLMYQPITGWVVDSTRIVDGKFRFKGNVPDIAVARLWIKRKEAKDAEFVQFFLEPGNLILKIKDEIAAAKFEGSKANAANLALKEREKPFFEQLTKLSRQSRELDKIKDVEGKKRVESEMEALNEKIDEQVYAAYVLENPESPIVSHALVSYIGSWPNVTVKKLEKTRALFDRLPASTKQRPSVKEFERRLGAAMNSTVGMPAMEFKLNDTAGRPVTLSSLRGKYVFIDFWASWCIPCRANNPYLVKAYHQFKGKDLVIMGIAFDKTNYDHWLEAIHTDKLPYLNLIDTKYPDVSSVGKQYNIGSIPQNVLIDPNGKIVAKNIEGADLAKKLAVFLGDTSSNPDKSK